jgi:exopolysaccharide biosynthesis polyprenyl glycosylphosphotransferase
VCALYAALIVTLFIRYGLNFNERFFDFHFIPFSVVFPVWLLIFYIAGLYDLRRLRNNVEFLQTLLLTLFVNALVTIAVFYLVPSFGITPKTNLFIFIGVFALFESWWRRMFNIRASFREGLNRVLLFDKGPLAQELHEVLAQNPQIGYAVKLWMSPDERTQDMTRLIKEHAINLVVVPSHFRHNPQSAKMLYELLATGIEVRDVPSLYEAVFRNIPLGGITESWFIEHSLGERRFYDDMKRGLEVVFAVALGVALLPLELLIAMLVALTSPGPAIYRQVRLGKHGVPFTLYKFRSMRTLAADGSAEVNGAQWSQAGDLRSTPIGKLLRASHLDELPQLMNIMKGELSFVGPRPERPEIVKKLVLEVPYYEIRLIVKPGITGWAQINYKKDETAADVMEKLSYDVYYLKNRSLVLDLAIIVKTVKLFFVNHT